MKPCLVFFHIPKTAGSSVNRLARQTIGPRAMFHIGPHSRIHRLLRDRPQFEELQSYDFLRFLLGHSVNCDHVRLIHPIAGNLAVTIRDPLALFVSRINYAEYVRTQWLPGLDTQKPRQDGFAKFLERNSDFMARFLVRGFSSMSPYGDEMSERNLTLILSCFAFIAHQDDLDTTIRPMLRALGIGEAPGFVNKRPHTITPDIDVDRFRALNQLDYFIHEKVRRQQETGAHAGSEIFGSQGRDLLEEFARRPKSDADIATAIQAGYREVLTEGVRLGYSKVFGYMRENGLTRKSCVKTLFDDCLDDFAADKKHNNAKSNSHEYFLLSKFIVDNNRDKQEAIRYSRKSLDLNPDNTESRDLLDTLTA